MYYLPYEVSKNEKGEKRKALAYISASFMESSVDQVELEEIFSEISSGDITPREILKVDLYQYLNKKMIKGKLTYDQVEEIFHKIKKELDSI